MSLAISRANQTKDDPSTLAYAVKHEFVKSFSTSGDADDSVPTAQAIDTDDYLM